MKLEDIRESVFAIKPDFGEVARVWGDKTLLEYYSQDFSPLLTPTDDVLNAIQDETSSILGTQVGELAHKSLKHKKWVNTADHHGLLCHPYFYTTAFARSHHTIRGEDTVTVTLPFAGISLGNDSFPRGFFFHDSKGKVERIFFKSLKERRLPVYALSPISKNEMIRERDRARTFDLSVQAHEKLSMVFSEFLCDERIWNEKTYSAQLTLMNSVFWRVLFSQTRGEFVYLEIESVVVRLLLLKHLVSETEIHSLLFNASWRDAFIELFSGVFGSHDTKSGTHFFWYIDYEKKTRRSLIVENDMLVTKEKDVVIPLTPESIADCLRNRTLMPSTALMLIIIHGVEKLTCGGGPSQLTYLRVMMGKWNELLARFGLHEDIPTTNIYCGDNTLFQVVSENTHMQGLATSIDLLLYGNGISSVVDTVLENTPINATIDALLPTLHHIYSKEKMLQDFSLSIHRLTIS